MDRNAMSDEDNIDDPSERGEQTDPINRRRFVKSLGVASAAGTVGLSGVVSASPDPQGAKKTLEAVNSQAVAKTLKERREFLKVLVANDVMSDKVLQDMENTSAQSVAESSSVVAKKDEDTGYILLTFPNESDELGLAFGDELAEVSLTYPDDVDGKAITEELNREVSGLVATDSQFCGSFPCSIPEENANDRCTAPRFPVGICGSYECGTVICGSNSLGWRCACCGGGHPWCNAPRCPDDRKAGVWCGGI